MTVTIKFTMDHNPGKLQILWETIVNILIFAGISDYEMENDL